MTSRVGVDSRNGRAIDWSDVDWSKNLHEIAEAKGCGYEIALRARQRHAGDGGAAPHVENGATVGRAVDLVVKHRVGPGSAAVRVGVSRAAVMRRCRALGVVDEDGNLLGGRR